MIFEIIIGVAAVAFFLWMLISPSGDNDKEIDPNDPRVIGNLTGLMGGSVVDAAVLRFALQRFEAQYGRKATARDLGIVAGMINGQDGQ